MRYGETFVMHRFFADRDSINEEEHLISLTGPDVNHVKNVLRMKVGDELLVCLKDTEDKTASAGSSMSGALSGLSDGPEDAGDEDFRRGNDYNCVIEEMTVDEVICRIRFVKRSDSELSSRVYLFQGLPKGDKLELVIQKCVELGVFEIIPVSCLRSVVKLDDKKAGKKRERWQQIAKGAAEQSHRALIPEVKSPMSFSDALKYADENCITKLIPYELCNDDIKETKSILENLKAGESVAFFIGPEGGFDEKEVKACMAAGFVPVTLGKRILRTETAPITVMSWLSLYL